jgi:hypothetical protein
MAILEFQPRCRQVKTGISGLFFLMPPEHRRERIAAMLRAGFDQYLVKDLTTRRPP